MVFSQSSDAGVLAGDEGGPAPAGKEHLMRLTRMRITVAAGLLAVSGTLAATAVAVAPASAGSTTVVMVNCAGQGQIRPGGYDIGCTANEMLATLHWQTWRGTAYG